MPFLPLPFLPVAFFTVAFFTRCPFYRCPFYRLPNLPFPFLPWSFLLWLFLPFPFLPFTDESAQFKISRIKCVFNNCLNAIYLLSRIFRCRNPNCRLWIEVSNSCLERGTDTTALGHGAEVSETFRHRSKCKAYLHNRSFNWVMKLDVYMNDRPNGSR